MIHPDLINGVDQNSKHPETFHIPSEEERQSVQIEKHVKIGLKNESGGERFWVIIKEREMQPNGTVHYRAVVDNHLYIFDLKLGESIEFGPEHILSIF